MIKGDELSNRKGPEPDQGGSSIEGPEPKGSGDFQAALREMRPRARRPEPEAEELATLRARIAHARSVAPPSGDNQFAQGCFIRGRNAALAIIDGEVAG